MLDDLGADEDIRQICESRVSYQGNDFYRVDDEKSALYTLCAGDDISAIRSVVDQSL